MTPAAQGPKETRSAGDYSMTPTGRLTFAVGQRRLEEAFAPADEPTVFGIEFSQVSRGATLGFELGFNFADDRARGVPLSGGGVGNLELFQSEFYAGLRAEAGDGPLHPYAGAGATWTTNETRVNSGGLQARESDSDLGAYAHAGLLFDLSRSVHLSLDGRMTFFTDYSIDGSKFDSDYAQVLVGVGTSF